MRELGQLQKQLADFQAIGVTIVGITMEDAETIAKQRKKNKLESLDIYADARGELVDALGLRHRGAGPEGSDTSRSASLLFGGDGRLLWMKANDNYRVRPQAEWVLARVRDALSGAANPEPAGSNP